MSQRIDGNATNPVADLYRTTARNAAGSSSSAPVAAAAATDTVRLTGDAVSLHQLDQTLAKVPVVDQGRVAAIKQALSEGRYALDPAAIADRLSHFEWQLDS
ncbi:MAG: flagellar biosynthesis anti-sigma factor FlgM [Nevskiaceae bacterium]|nr:MAG: flagellar biosynthesis anti-sigma factor FlgM [Nevskiaceae bacterium]TAM27253.1 MAG: flagellar biosynthesis anti-sigma factor FlgM [Nevskiaceae bacterium]